jgi:hypothetical protein
MASDTVAARSSMRAPDSRPAIATKGSSPEAGAGKATCRKPSPVRSSVACRPDPSPMRPSGAAMMPLLATLPPSSAAKPPLPTLMAPLLLTVPVPLPLKPSVPWAKSRSLMSSVEATKPPPIVTVPDAVMAMPLGLTRNICPLPLTAPAMVEAVAPVTRLRIAAPAFGWLKVTAAPCPTEKLSQLTTARWLVWSTVMALPPPWIAALPSATLPPCGRLCAWASELPDSSTAIRAIEAGERTMLRTSPLSRH